MDTNTRNEAAPILHTISAAGFEALGVLVDLNTPGAPVRYIPFPCFLAEWTQESTAANSELLPVAYTGDADALKVAVLEYARENLRGLCGYARLTDADIQAATFAPAPLADFKL